MSPKKEEQKIEVEWIIVRSLPNLFFDVQLPKEYGEKIIKWYLSWKMKVNFIRPIEWDRVIIELSPYDLTKGRIIFRKK